MVECLRPKAAGSLSPRASLILRRNPLFKPIVVSRAVVGQPYAHRAEPLKRHVAFVLAQEIEEPLVIFGLEIEASHEGFVAASRSLQPPADDRPQIFAGQVP